MKVTGSATVSLDDFILTDLRGVEARCAETNHALTPGEKVVIFAEGVVTKNGLAVHVDPAIRFIKVYAGDGSPLEDFVSRYLNNILPQAPASDVPGAITSTGGQIVSNTTTSE